MPDWVRFTDSDVLRDLPSAVEKSKWLRKAKVESLRREVLERVDEISQAWEFDDKELLSVLTDAFREDLKNYGIALSPSQRQMWIDKAALAACGRNEESQARGPVVYFVSAGNELVKIGYTTNLSSRLKSLRTAHPNELRVLLVTSGSREDEQELHQRFAEFRVGREWFKLSCPIKVYIDSQILSRE